MIVRICVCVGECECVCVLFFLYFWEIACYVFIRVLLEYGVITLGF